MNKIYLIAAIKGHTIIYLNKGKKYGDYWSGDCHPNIYQFTTEEYALDFIKHNDIELPDSDWTLIVEKWEKTAVTYY